MVSPEEVSAELSQKLAGFERTKREGMIRRLGQVLAEEAKGDSSHPAALAQKALETGSAVSARQYFETELERVKAEKVTVEDEAALAKLDVRQSSLERWVETLGVN